MSEELKRRLAEELGVRETVEREGWGAVSSRDCGRLVQLAVAHAERMMAARAVPPRGPRAQ
ncbi:MAG: small, acid-soluble spore protein, alpha/beta type [Clostridia bacterium]|nr:small, acid-soluble spore protein, alpha/beta type [Clostridia bacterium]